MIHIQHQLKYKFTAIIFDYLMCTININCIYIKINYFVVQQICKISNYVINTLLLATSLTYIIQVLIMIL